MLQGGEDPYFTDDKICALIRQIKAQYPDCAVTLSIGEKEHDSYQAFFDAGADRYLLRHETADEAHYGKLHPAEMFWKHRMDCLWDLKEIGYQVGCGFMVGSPEQTVDTLYEDLQFIRKLQPHMVGIGPFIPQKDTPFGEKRQEQWKIRFGFYPLSDCCSRMCCCHQQLHWEPFIRWAGKKEFRQGQML